MYRFTVLHKITFAIYVVWVSFEETASTDIKTKSILRKNVLPSSATFVDRRLEKSPYSKCINIDTRGTSPTSV